MEDSRALNFTPSFGLIQTGESRTSSLDVAVETFRLLKHMDAMARTLKVSFDHVIEICSSLNWETKAATLGIWMLRVKLQTFEQLDESIKQLIEEREQAKVPFIERFSENLIRGKLSVNVAIETDVLLSRESPNPVYLAGDLSNLIVRAK